MMRTGRPKALSSDVREPSAATAGRRSRLRLANAGRLRTNAGHSFRRKVARTFGSLMNRPTCQKYSQRDVRRSARIARERSANAGSEKIRIASGGFVVGIGL